MPGERFMRHHYGPSGYVKPGALTDHQKEIERLTESLRLAIYEKRKEQAENTRLREIIQGLREKENL